MSDIVSDIKEKIKMIKNNNQKTKELRENEQSSLDNTLNMLNNFKKKENDNVDYNLTSNSNNSQYDKYERIVTNDNIYTNTNNINVNEYRKSKNINSEYQQYEDRERDNKTINTDKNYDEAKNEYYSMMNKRQVADNKDKVFKQKNSNYNIEFNEKINNNSRSKIEMMYDDYEKSKSSDIRIRDKSKNLDKFDRCKNSEFQYQKTDLRDEICTTNDRKKNQMSFLAKADEKNCNFETRKNQKRAQLIEILTDKECVNNNYNSNNRNMNYDDGKFKPILGVNSKIMGKMKNIINTLDGGTLIKEYSNNENNLYKKIDEKSIFKNPQKSYQVNNVKLTDPSTLISSKAYTPFKMEKKSKFFDESNFEE